MKVLKIIGIILLSLVALYFIVAAFLPSKVKIEETVSIEAPASVIFNQVNNFKNWPAWSPFDATDTNIIHQYSGPEAGVGAFTSWESTMLGSGAMTISASEPYTKIVTDLDFYDESPAQGYFYFDETDGTTSVTWGFESEAGYPNGRYMLALMKGVMSEMFTKGLNSLKEIAESMPDPVPVEVVDFPEMKALVILDSCSWDEMGNKMEELFGELMGYTMSKSIPMAGMPFTVYHTWDEERQFTSFENGIPVEKERKGKGRIKYKLFPATKAVKATHYGAYDKSYEAYMALQRYVEDHGLEESGGPVQVYVNDPMAEPDTSKWQTDIYFRIK